MVTKEIVPWFWAMLCLMQLLFVVSECDLPKIKEDQVSVLGWTEAHDAIYGWPVQGCAIPKDRVGLFLSAATDAFLCQQNDFGQTALHLAVRQDLVDVVQIYVDRRICVDTPNRDGDTALHYAAVWGRPEAVKLLRTVADTEIRNAKGETAFDDAIATGNTEIVELLKNASDAYYEL